MKSRLNFFIFVSLLIHLLVLVLFSFEKQELVEPTNQIVVDLQISSKSASLNRSASASRNASTKDSRSKSFKSSTSSPQSSATEAKTPSLIRNQAPSSSGHSRQSPAVSRDDEANKASRRLTLNKSQDSIPSSRSFRNSSESENQSGGKTGSQTGSTANDFEAKSVFDRSPAKNSSQLSRENFDLGDSSSVQGSAKSSRNSTGSGSAGKSSGNPNSGFNWKNSGQRSLVSKDELLFPKSLVGKGVNGEVVIAFKVAPDGKVYGIELVNSSGYSELDSAVKEQVRSFRFNSASDKKISEVEYSYLFKLEEKK